MNTFIIIISCVIILLVIISYIVYNIIKLKKEKEKEKEEEKEEEKIVKFSTSSSNTVTTEKLDKSKTINNSIYLVLSQGLIILGALAFSDFIVELINTIIPNKNKKFKLLIRFIITVVLIGISILSIYLLDISLT